jgi:uncharacterized SAM-binding protein YcdF (DUF218 family)
VRLLAVSGLGVVFVAAVATFRIWQQGTQDEQRPADAIVVLGAAQYDGRPSPVFAARLDHAIELFKAGVASTFIVTGGKVPGDRTTEAAVAREYAVERGVPAEAILGEDEGRNTLSSLRAVATLMDGHGLRSAVFVSDRTHMLRVLRIADDLGIAAYGSPVTRSPAQEDVRRQAQATVHELGALAVYFLTGGAPLVEQPGG